MTSRLAWWSATGRKWVIRIPGKVIRGSVPPWRRRHRHDRPDDSTRGTRAAGTGSAGPWRPPGQRVAIRSPAARTRFRPRARSMLDRVSPVLPSNRFCLARKTFPASPPSLIAPRRVCSRRCRQQFLSAPYSRAVNAKSALRPRTPVLILGLLSRHSPDITQTFDDRRLRAAIVVRTDGREE